jgi:hypothetical protein
MTEDFAERFKVMSDNDLIGALNSQVGNNGWVASRATYFVALKQELNNRGFDYSAITDKGSFSFARKIGLEGKKIVVV